MKIETETHWPAAKLLGYSAFWLLMGMSVRWPILLFPAIVVGFSAMYGIKDLDEKESA